MHPQAQSRGRELRTRADDALGPGSSPLKNPAHEKLAREFAAGASMSDSWRAIGRDPAKSNNARRTLRRQEIQERIEYLRGEFNYQAGISLAALQARLLRIADANVVDFFEADATTKRLRVRDLTELPRVVTGTIAELQVDAKGAVKIKTSDRLGALNALLKTIGADPEAEKGLTLEELILGSIRDRETGGFRVEVAAGAPNNSPGRPPQTINEPGVRRVRV
jgi:terminase small subunit-like protein